MKRNLLAVIVLLSILYGCSEGNRNNDPFQSLEGTKWKLVGLVDAETGTLQVLEPIDCKECYTLVWSVDDKVTAHIANSDILKLDMLNLNPAYMEDRLYPEFYPIYDEFYTDCMLFRSYFIGTESYVVTENELKLYCVDSNKNRFMLFKPF